MKILQIIPDLKKGGAERLVLDLCHELQKQGHEVVLITFRSENEYAFLSNDITHKVIPSSVQFSLRGKDRYQVAELQAFIDDFAPDVIHSHLFETECVLSGIQYPTAKYFVHFHDNMAQFVRPGFQTLRSRKGMTDAYERKQILKSYAKRNVHFIAISKDTLKYIHANLPSEIPSTLLHNAIDVNRFTNDIPWEQREKHIVMIGSLVEKKRQSLAIQVLKELISMGSNYHLYLLGEGPMKEKLQNLAKDLHISEFVHFEGNVDNPENYLSQAKIYLHTAIYEPFGLVLLEAMAAGCPVVCKDGGGNRDIIIQGENGYILDSSDPNEYASYIRKTTSDIDHTKTIISQSQVFIQKYDIKSYTDHLTELYQN